jgi:histidyl-tRNA synthetase
MVIKRPRGTQDFLPEDTAVWQILEEHIRDLCRRYGYEEIRTPMFEATELFQRGVGETTDIVNKEMFTFLDKGGRSLTLRPEGTASVARAYAENKLYGRTPPWKMYYLGSMFRQERPQAGRFHEFHQFGVEVMGTGSALADAEVVLLAWELCRELGLTGLEVQLNSVGCPVCREEHRQALTAFLEPRTGELCEDCRVRLDKNPLRILDCKNAGCQAVTAEAPVIADFLCGDCREHFAETRGYLDALGVAYRLDPRLVRGLDYYRKTAFEIALTGIGAQSAICGGGRYDGLVEEIGGPPAPGIGFAMGLERLLGALALQGVTLGAEAPPRVVIAALGDEARVAGAALAANLRRAGMATLMDLQAQSLKSQLKYADRQKARQTLIIGEDELRQKVVLLRDMATGEQRAVPWDDVEAEITQTL